MTLDQQAKDIAKRIWGNIETDLDRKVRKEVAESPMVAQFNDERRFRNYVEKAETTFRLNSKVWIKLKDKVERLAWSKQ